MITPMSPSYNRNQTSFGMAFQKPCEAVIGKFRKAITPLTPEQRKVFVEEVGKIVDSQKNNPVPIQHGLTTGNHYITIVRGQYYYNPSQEPVKEILQTMKRAAIEADNQNNIDKTMKDLNSIL